MELARSVNPLNVAIGSVDGSVEDVVKCKKISIADNKLGREAVMINAPTDLGHKEYKHCNFGSITVQLNSFAVTSAGLKALPAEAISSAIKSTRHSERIGNPVQLYSSIGRKSGEVYAKICPELLSNWIAEDMVRKGNLKTKRRETVKTARYEGELLASTGHLVEFDCPGKTCKHRFHVIRNPPFPFDMLYGAEFVEEVIDKA